MKLNYCPECATLLHKQTETKYVCMNNHAYYNNPRGSCSLIVSNDHHELLFARRGIEPAKGKYDFPGGFLDFPEDAYHAVIREAKEEMGIIIDILDLQLIDTSRADYTENISTCDFVFYCNKWRGNINAHDDVAALEWKPLDFLNSTDFAWHYPYLYDKLKKII